VPDIVNEDAAAHEESMRGGGQEETRTIHTGSVLQLLRNLKKEAANIQYDIYS
jgi:hypothetical protein